MAEFQAYWNGEWIPYSQMRIEPADRGFYVGDAVFEVVRTFNGKSFRQKEHIDRLYRSLKYVKMDPGISEKEFFDLSEEAVERNRHMLPEAGDLNIHQFVTRGKGRRTWNATSPNVGIKVGPLDFENFYWAYDDGLHAVITKQQTYPSASLDPKVKHYSRMNFNLAEVEADEVDPGALPILRDENGDIAEGSGYNVLIVSDGVIRTADDKSILQGVSRGMVYDLARQLDIPVSEEKLQPYDVYTADEVFLASTTWCVVPISYVDKRPIGNGKPGPIVNQLLAAWSETVGIDIVDQAVRIGSKRRPRPTA